MSKHWEILMRNRLATAALIALLGSMADVSPLPAQLTQFPSSAAAPLGHATAPLADKVATAKTAIRRASHADRKRHVIRSLPNQRKIAEKKGYKRVSEKLK